MPRTTIAADYRGRSQRPCGVLPDATSNGYNGELTRPLTCQGPDSYAFCPRPRKRAVRGRPAPLQAHDRKNRPSDRAPRTRVLRKAHRRAQAQEGGRREAPLQAPAQPAAAAEAVLIPVERVAPGGAKRFAPFCFSAALDLR